MNAVILTPACRLALLNTLTSGLTLRLLHESRELRAPGYSPLRLSADAWKLDEPSGTATLQPQKFAFTGEGDEVTGWRLDRGNEAWIVRTRQPFPTEDGAGLSVTLTVDLLGPRG